MRLAVVKTRVVVVAMDAAAVGVVTSLQIQASVIMIRASAGQFSPVEKVKDLSVLALTVVVQGSTTTHHEFQAVGDVCHVPFLTTGRSWQSWQYKKKKMRQF